MNWIFDQSRPIWLQIREKLTVSIITGIYPPGSPFPSVRELASQAKVNPNTMQRALSNMESEGILINNRTQSRNVTDDTGLIASLKYEYAKETTNRFIEEMKQLEYQPQQIQEILESFLKGEKNNE